ncbi:MAG: PLP-dependent aminotransferase family protein [Steroidobacteraceae bacterium]
MRLYQQLAQQLEVLLGDGTLAVGDRLPSIRELCAQRKVSPATAMRAYEQLEARDLIESRARSGYYVARPPAPVTTPAGIARTRARKTPVDVSDLVFEILDSVHDRSVVPLGSAFPAPSLFPWSKLARHLGSAARRADPWSSVASVSSGHAGLRRQIAQRYLRRGVSVSAAEIVITAGALEALTLCLQVLTKPGDLVGIESPSFHGCLQAIEALGLRAVEIPTHPSEGVDLGALALALERNDIRACWFMSSFQNPLGATMPDEKKADLATLLAHHDVALIEDDVYAELHFGAAPRPVKAFDTEGLVLNCGSFSKCLAPGYRLGWVAAGPFAAAIQRRKITSSLATSVPIQEGIASFLQQDAYDAHLERLRTALAAQQTAALRSLQQHLRGACRVSRPDGGYFLWLEFARETDSLALHAALLQKGISIAPGPIFSPRREFRNCVRINCGHPWTVDFDAAIGELGASLSAAASVSDRRRAAPRR